MGEMTQEPEPIEPRPEEVPGPVGRRAFWVLAAIIFLAGAALRIVPSASFKAVGFDEVLYRTYLLMLDKKGLGDYASLTEAYLADQEKEDSITKLPPTRFLYIFSGWVWKKVAFGDAPPVNLKQPNAAEEDPALVSLHRISCLFSVLFLALSGVAATRMAGARIGLATMALVATSPVQLHMSQHALIDGFLAFWGTLSLWTLWENLRRPNQPAWLAAHAVVLALMVMTKENSFFVYCSLCGVMAVVLFTKAGAQIGKVTPRLAFVSVVGPLVGVLLLMSLAGGLGNFIDTYRLLVAKASNLEYAIKTGDGPWHRYIVDLMLATPIVTCLAIAALFSVMRNRPAYVYLALFVAFSYLIMCNVRFGMNLRYSTIWDLPLAALAAGQIAAVADFFGRRSPLVLALLVFGTGLYGMRQYQQFTVESGMYEMVTEGLLRSQKILK